jgi:hypothetical protein
MDLEILSKWRAAVSAAAGVSKSVKIHDLSPRLPLGGRKWHDAGVEPANGALREL